MTYNGQPFKSFQVSQTAAYVPQTDSHMAQLTVRETFDFGARVQGTSNQSGTHDQAWPLPSARGTQRACLRVFVFLSAEQRDPLQDPALSWPHCVLPGEHQKPPAGYSIRTIVSWRLLMLHSKGWKFVKHPVKSLSNTASRSREPAAARTCAHTARSVTEIH